MPVTLKRFEGRHRFGFRGIPIDGDRRHVTDEEIVGGRVDRDQLRFAVVDQMARYVVLGGVAPEDEFRLTEVWGAVPVIKVFV
jgi:hypothetical protein